MAGVNHFPVLTALDVDGQDGFDDPRRSMVDEAGGLEALAPHPGRPVGDDFSPLDFCQRHLLALDLLDRWGALPAAGDRHIVGVRAVGADRGVGMGCPVQHRPDPHDSRRRHQAGYVADVDAWIAGSKPLQTWPSGELPALVIDSLVTGEARHLPGNVPNTGQVPDLPEESVVESICVVDGDGVRGRDVATLPPPFAELLRRHAAVAELTWTPPVDGDRSLGDAAFLLDPLAGRGDLGDIEPWSTSCCRAPRPWLPQFAG